MSGIPPNQNQQYVNPQLLNPQGRVVQLGNCEPCDPQPREYYEQPTCEKKEPIIFREYQKVEQPAPTPTPAHRDEFYRVMPEPVNQDVEYSHLDFDVVVVKSMDEL